MLGYPWPWKDPGVGFHQELWEFRVSTVLVCIEGKKPNKQWSLELGISGGRLGSCHKGQDEVKSYTLREQIQWATVPMGAAEFGRMVSVIQRPLLSDSDRIGVGERL